VDARDKSGHDGAALRRNRARPSYAKMAATAEEHMSPIRKSLIGKSLVGNLHNGKLHVATRASLALAGLLTLALPAHAQSGADFFKGRTVTYIVATSAGGGYDLYGRLVAEFMQRYLPGSTFIVRNLPGAGHLVGTNTIFASKPDGLTIGTFNTGLIYNQLVGLPGMKFDLTKMSWIGKATTDPRVMAIAQQSPIKSYEDLATSKNPVNLAVSGVGSANYVETTILANALKWPAKVLTGYNGNDDQLAMRRGEIAGTLGSRSSFEQFVHNGYGRFVFQIGGKDKDVPQLRDLVKDPAALQLIALVQSQGDLARLTAGPPGIPKPQLDALRDAYRKAMADKELQEKAAKLERPVDPGYGDEVLNAIVTALKQPPETIALLAKALKKK
jgi:tripartite-type tricarboxylate transporter receptor subunit TctC